MSTCYDVGVVDAMVRRAMRVIDEVGGVVVGAATVVALAS